VDMDLGFFSSPEHNGSYLSDPLPHQSAKHPRRSLCNHSFFSLNHFRKPCNRPNL
jgi:hypothetical protein